MPEYDNSNQAAIWKNDNRETEKHPHFKGSGEIDGVEYWVSGWKREADANPKAPALKLRFTKKDEVHNKGLGEAKQIVAEFDDDIPFREVLNDE